MFNLSNGFSGPCLKLNGVWYGYGAVPVVEDVSFTVQRGEFMAVLGPNGSGKSTLLKLALGLVAPQCGSVELFGSPPSKLRAVGRVGYVPQKVDSLRSQFPSAVEEIVSQGLYRGFDPMGIFRRPGGPTVTEALETAGLTAIRSHRISSLSVGQQQRVLFARALVRDPEILVLDEPVAGIDAAGQERFYALLRRLNRDKGMSIVMVSHDIGAVMREATTVACINRTIVFHGDTHALTQKELGKLYGFSPDVLVHDALHEHR
ncbi:MAG: metal ABC transporter ATP-binding protein [SAR202 cluster bacterium]|nr:metal ABC transporter ATP-binding protein [SAR202 cluster bacterium]